MPKQPTPFELILCKIILKRKTRRSVYTIDHLIHKKDCVYVFGIIKFPGSKALFSCNQEVFLTEILEEQINSQKP